MKSNPVIDEVRRVRTELSDELGNDPKRFLEYFSALQEKYRKEGWNYVEPPKRNAALQEDVQPYSATDTSKNSPK